MSDEPVNPVTEHKAISEAIPSEGPKSAEEQEKQKAFDTISGSDKVDGVSMSVKVHSPSRVYYDDLAFSVTATNDTGEFDILPKHHNFICLLNACDLIIRTVHQGKRTLAISGGIMHVKADQIIVFLDI
ncbi:MAG TPA: hypothetical protein VNG32_02405 [Candidatus Dormibacteraeota bacterium]|nr:hypothetical protein [Candidatus Dormibacteraeota bacterium]